MRKRNSTQKWRRLHTSSPTSLACPWTGAAAIVEAASSAPAAGADGADGGAGPSAADEAKVPLRFDAHRLRRASLCASHCDCCSALDTGTSDDAAGAATDADAARLADTDDSCGAADVAAVVVAAAIRVSVEIGAGVAAELRAAAAFGRPRPAANDDEDAASRAFLSSNAAAADDDDDDGDAFVAASAEADDLCADAGSGDVVSSEPKNRVWLRFDDDGVCARAARARSRAASEYKKYHKNQMDFAQNETTI